MLYGNITLFGVVADHLHPAGATLQAPPPQLSDIVTQHTYLGSSVCKDVVDTSTVVAAVLVC